MSRKPGAQQVELSLGALTVVTGPSGPSKSSLAFDTIYGEGQRRYVETLAPYAHQFLDRMDKRAIDAIEGVPAAIAIDRTKAGEKAQPQFRRILG